MVSLVLLKWRIRARLSLLQAWMKRCSYKQHTLYSLNLNSIIIFRFDINWKAVFEVKLRLKALKVKKKRRILLFHYKLRTISDCSTVLVAAAVLCWLILPAVVKGSWVLSHSVTTLTFTSTSCSRAGWMCNTRPQTTPELWTLCVCLYCDSSLRQKRKTGCQSEN